MDELKRAVAVDVGGTKVAAALVTLSDAGEPAIEHYGKAPTEAKLGGRHVLEVIVGQVERVLREADCAVCGIGVSTGGVVEPLTGDITYANDMMPGWGGTHLGAELEARFGLKARVMNDVHARALGEVLGNMVNLFDPECVVLSGSVAKCGPVWHRALKSGWDGAVMPPQAHTPIRDGQLGDNAPLVGAAENLVRSAYVGLE